ncbi:MAG TPA: DNA-3-methyladenine glycosylase I [Acidimicrobiales bacterium]|nr:DNA-3-methyladenine glycosylase I [Acidimicrobiales bacterium]
MAGVQAGDDGRARCPWGLAPPEYREYHDQEWGRPVDDDRAVFEKLCLEGFQAGLSWLTILRKRPGFRQAFAGFDPAAVARFDDGDVDRLLADPGIVRHRAKILATIANARAAVRLADQGVSLAGLVWSYQPPARPAPTTTGDVAGSTPESKALSADLRRRGFRFVGPTTVYSSMQSLGVVDDHLEGCHLRAAVEADRRAFRPPAV